MTRWYCFLLAGALLGCRPEEQKTETIDPAAIRAARQMPEPLRNQIDSGNQAIRSRQFEQARRHFSVASRMDDKSKAAWFGLYLAERGLGNADAANAALRRAQKLAPGATLIQPVAGDTTKQ